MDLKDFLKLLKKYLPLLIIVPMLTAIVTYFAARKLPKQFISSAKISTGITDNSRALIDPLGGGLQESKINAEFSNLKEIMLLKKMFDMLSYKLAIHDLGSASPFRGLGKNYMYMSPAQKMDAIAIFDSKLKNNMEPLNLTDTHQEWLNGLLESMGYDERTLRKTLDISREESSDFVSITATTENSLLSAYMVNEYCEGFIAYQSDNSRDNQTASIGFLGKLLDQKRKTLDSVTKDLQQFKINNGILNLEEQSKSLQTRISATSDMLLLEQRDADSYAGAIAHIKSNFAPETRAFMERDLSKFNVDVTLTREKLKAATEKYTHTMDSRDSAAVAALTQKLISQINLSQDTYITNPLVAKDDQRKTLNTLQVQYDQTRFAKQSIQNQLNNLKQQFNALVPQDAILKTKNFAIDNATKEYQDILAKFNVTNLQSTASSKLLLTVKAVPNVAEPSKQKLYTIIAGVVMFMIILVAIFVMWYMDDSINHPVRLANATNLPVLGSLNKLKGNAIDLRRLWHAEHTGKMQEFKDLLRSIRFEVDQELGNEKVLAITSMKEGEGKTLVAVSLAYSYAMINKKVLLIDGNFDNPTITKSVNPDTFIEDVFRDAPGHQVTLTAATNVLGNHGGDITMLEMSSEKALRDKLDELKKIYDVILIETPPLSALSKAKEWFTLSSKIIAVFEAGQSIVNGKKIIIKYFQGVGDKFAGWVLNKTITPDSKKKH